MIYFTPELIAEFQSLNDNIADKAHDKWEEAIKKYEEYLKSIGDKLNDNIRNFLKIYLHDARIINRKNNFIKLQFEDESEATIVYSLVGKIRKKTYD